MKQHVRAALVCAAALLVTAPGFAVGGAARAWQPTLTPPGEGALPLWEVRSGERTLYLLGSIHLLRPTVYPLDPAIYRAFDAASVVAFELSPEEIAAAVPLMMSIGMLPDGRTFRDELPADVAAELERRVQDLGLPLAAAVRMKPWFIALQLSALTLQQAGFTPESGLDLHLQARARETGQRVTGLETAREQFEVFDGLDGQGQEAFVRSTLAELDESAARLDEATAMWQRGDAEALAAMMTESMREQPVLTERLLDDRNRAWIPHIEALLTADEPAIVVVGMGHLVGEGSVVQLLRERGYTVTRVRCPSDQLPCAA